MTDQRFIGVIKVIEAEISPKEFIELKELLSKVPFWNEYENSTGKTTKPDTNNVDSEVFEKD